jgi:alanine dehydrogenase
MMTRRGAQMALWVSEREVGELLTMRDAIAAVEEVTRRAATGEAIVQPRHRLELPQKGFLHYMAGADVSEGLVGMKIYTSVGGALRFLVLLYRSQTGELLAMIEADEMGVLRTGAASGVATKYLARAEAKTVGIVGTGHQARGQLMAVAEVRRLERVRVYGRDAARREKFARGISELLKVEVEAVGSAEEAVRGADIVVTATTASKPVVTGEMLAAGMHVNAIGANFPQKRELDDAAIGRCDKIFVDSVEQARIEAGDLVQPFGADDAKWKRVGELGDVIAGKARGREGAREITLFKSSGIAIWDVACAARVFRLAKERGVGREVGLWGGSGRQKAEGRKPATAGKLQAESGRR